MLHLCVALLAFAVVLAASGPARGALEKPSYAAGDRWVYVLEGSLRAFPGFNESEIGTLDFRLVGRVEIEVIGPVEAPPVHGLRVDTRTSGFINGTFAQPGGPIPGDVSVTGTFSSYALELWEDQAYLPIASNSTSTLRADVSYIITAPLEIDTRVNATTSVDAIPPFRLEVGGVATAQLTTDFIANSTFTFLGQTMSWENATTLSSPWRRELLSLQDVSVEAGTFSAYRLNQTLGSFPGIPGSVPGGGNETAYFSDDVGYYVKRVAYVNATSVAEMRLKSYTYAAAARPSGLSATDVLLLLAVPAAAVIAAVLLYRRRKARASDVPRAESPPAPPESQGGGLERAR